MGEITVFTKPGCVQCDYTKKSFESLNVPYEAIDVSQDPSALDEIMSLGYKQLPVVKAGADHHWSGFQPDMINALHSRSVA